MNFPPADYMEAFLRVAGFGPPIPGKPVPQSACEKYSGVLPDALLKIWAEFGCAGFGDGRLWPTDPTEWAPILEEWLHGTEPPLRDDYHIILRDAFGKFDCWGPTTGVSMRVDVVPGRLVARLNEAAQVAADGHDWEILTWLTARGPDRIDAYRYDNERPIFDSARRVHGQLTYDEVHGFFPPVSLSGAPENSDLHPRRRDRPPRVLRPERRRPTHRPHLRQPAPHASPARPENAVSRDMTHDLFRRFLHKGSARSRGSQKSRILYQDAGQIEDVVAAAERWCGRQASQFADVARHIRENVPPALEDGWTNASGVSQVLGVSWTVTLSGGIDETRIRPVGIITHGPPR